MANGNGPVLLEQEKEEARQYRLSLWWVEHRERVMKLGIILFAIADGLLLMFALWTFTDSYLVSYGRERDAFAAMATTGQDDLHAYTDATKATDITSGPVTVIAGGEGRYDLHSTITNPNGDWYAQFDYRFRSGSFETETARGFILPAQEKPLLALGVRAPAVPTGAEVIIESVAWRRVDKHVTGVYGPWAQDRLAITISDVSFSTELVVDSQTIGRVTFTVRNDTAFSYYDPAFIILLKRGNTIVGVNRTTLSSLDSGESREVIVNWFGTLPSASLTEVVPEIDIFDPAVYKPVGQ